MRRVAIVHTADTLEAWDFCRGVASYRPRSGMWGLRSIPMEPDPSPAFCRQLSQIACDGLIMGHGISRTLKSLHERGLIDVVGRGEGMGRPLLYGTTPIFLEYFALRHLEELPRADELAIALRAEPRTL